MPAITVENPLVLPVVHVEAEARPRPVRAVARAHRSVEGAGFPVWRAFPQGADSRMTDPFFLLDQMGPVGYAPNEAKGAPWHPHRGFETVTYMVDGVMAHHDSAGGGGVIGEGDTQWMTAGAGILHDEVPTEAFLRSGGLSHGVQLWVNLPARLKMSPPRYQAIEGPSLTLLRSPDGGALIRLIAGDLGGHAGPGVTHTPITYTHVSLRPGARVELPWRPDFNAMAYVLSGRAQAGTERRPVDAHTLVIFGEGDSVVIQADDHQLDDPEAAGSPDLEVLVLGGLPIGEPIAHYGPFLMNTREEIRQAVEDFNAGRMGRIPARSLG